MSELVDWELAGSVARALAGADAEPDAGAGFGRAAADARAAVEGYTGLRPAEPVPEPEWISRREWAAVNLESLRCSVAVYERRLEQGGSLPRPIAGPVGAVIGRIAAVQVGTLVGYASRRVLGQFEFPLLAEEGHRPRLLFVGPNVVAAQRELGSDPDTVLRWIALHEVTHAVHFAAVPWLRPYLAGLANELIEDARLGIAPSEVAALAGRMLSSDPRSLLAELAAADPITLLTPPESRALLSRVQTTMAMIEGFAEHVMDAAAGRLGIEVGSLRIAIERRRRERGPFARLVGWLLGIELKLRQYREGKRFVDEIVGRGGIEALNRAWLSPEALPSAGELAEPELWLDRTSPAEILG